MAHQPSVRIVAADAGPGLVAGTVIYEDGRPAKGATVSAFPLKGVPTNREDAFVTKISSTIAARLNLSGVEFFAGHPCTIGGQQATCGAHFVDWSGGGGHEPIGWVPFPGDEKALWEADINYEGQVSFGKTIDLLQGRLELLLQKQRLVSEILTNGTVVWPPSATGNLG